MPEPSNVGTFWKDADTEDPVANGHPALVPGLNTRETAFRDWIAESSTETSVDAKTASFTLALSQKGQAVQVDSASAVVVTVPANATVGFPVGSWVEVDRMGAGSVTFAATGGVTILSAGGFLALRVQYSTAVIRKTATDTWLLVGDTA